MTTPELPPLRHGPVYYTNNGTEKWVLLESVEARERILLDHIRVLQASHDQLLRDFNRVRAERDRLSDWVDRLQQEGDE